MPTSTTITPEQLDQMAARGPAGLLSSYSPLPPLPPSDFARLMKPRIALSRDPFAKILPGPLPDLTDEEFLRIATASRSVPGLQLSFPKLPTSTRPSGQVEISPLARALLGLSLSGTDTPSDLVLPPSLPTLPSSDYPEPVCAQITTTTITISDDPVPSSPPLAYDVEAIVLDAATSPSPQTMPQPRPPSPEVVIPLKSALNQSISRIWRGRSIHFPGPIHTGEDSPLQQRIRDEEAEDRRTVDAIHAWMEEVMGDIEAPIPEASVAAFPPLFARIHARGDRACLQVGIPQWRRLLRWLESALSPIPQASAEGSADAPIEAPISYDPLLLSWCISLVMRIRVQEGPVHHSLYSEETFRTLVDGLAIHLTQGDPHYIGGLWNAIAALLVDGQTPEPIAATIVTGCVRTLTPSPTLGGRRGKDGAVAALSAIVASHPHHRPWVLEEVLSALTDGEEPDVLALAHPHPHLHASYLPDADIPISLRLLQSCGSDMPRWALWALDNARLPAAATALVRAAILVAPRVDWPIAEVILRAVLHGHGHAAGVDAPGLVVEHILLQHARPPLHSPTPLEDRPRMGRWLCRVVRLHGIDIAMHWVHLWAEHAHAQDPSSPPVPEGKEWWREYLEGGGEDVSVQERILPEEMNALKREVAAMGSVVWRGDPACFLFLRHLSARVSAGTDRGRGVKVLGRAAVALLRLLPPAHADNTPPPNPEVPEAIRYISIALHGRLHDSSIIVRDAAIEAIVNIVCDTGNQTRSIAWSLLSSAYRPLLALLQDPSVMVQKRVIRSLRLIYEWVSLHAVPSAASRGRDEGILIDLGSHLLSMVGSEEDTVKSLALRMVKEVWFGGAGGHGIIEKAHLQWQTKILLAVGQTPILEGEKGARHLGEVLKEVLGGSEKSTGVRIVEEMVEMVIENLLDVEESMKNADKKSKTERVLQCCWTLEQFSKVTHVHVIRHIRVMEPYVMYDAPGKEGQRIQRAVIALYHALLPLLRREVIMLEWLEEHLLKIMNTCSSTVLPITVAALSRLSSMIRPGRMRMIFHSCHDALVKGSEAESSLKRTPAEDTRIIRFSLVAGLIAKEAWRYPSMRLDPAIIRQVCDVLVELISVERGNSLSVRRCATQALGYMCAGFPQFLLLASVQSSLHRIFASGHEQERCAALLLLLTYLRDDRERVEALQGMEAAAGGGIGEALLLSTKGEGPIEDSGIASMVMQEHLTHVKASILHAPVDEARAMQRLSLDLLEEVIDQGLVHPLKCIDVIIALEGSSHGGMRRQARRLHARLADRHPDLMHSHLGACIRESFRYQEATSPALEGPLAQGGDMRGGPRGAHVVEGQVQSVLGEVYALMGRARKEDARKRRRDFLTRLLAWVEGGIRAKSPGGWSRARWGVEAMAYLPYEWNGEAASVVQGMEGIVGREGPKVEDRRGKGGAGGGGGGREYRTGALLLALRLKRYLTLGFGIPPGAWREEEEAAYGQSRRSSSRRSSRRGGEIREGIDAWFRDRAKWVEGGGRHDFVEWGLGTMGAGAVDECLLLMTGDAEARTQYRASLAEEDFVLGEAEARARAQAALFVPTPAPEGDGRKYDSDAISSDEEEENSGDAIEYMS